MRKRPYIQQEWCERIVGNPVRREEQTDSLYIELNPRPNTDSREVVDGLVADLDADGNVVGLDIDQASKKLELGSLEALGLPTTSLRVA